MESQLQVRPLTLSAFVKMDNHRSGSAYVKLKWYDAQGALIGSTNSTTRRSGTNDWTRLYVQVPPGAAPAGAAHVKASLVVEVNAGGTVGTAYFDAVRLEEALVATAYQYGVPGEAAHNNWVTRITNPAGDFLTFAYNGSGFVTKVTPNGNAAQAVTYTPDGLQRLRSVTLPNGLTTSYSYTGNGPAPYPTATTATATGQACRRPLATARSAARSPTTNWTAWCGLRTARGQVMSASAMTSAVRWSSGPRPVTCTR